MLPLSLIFSASAALKYYINGKGSLARSQAYDAHVPHVNQFNDLTISKPNSNNKIEEMLPMKFDQFVTWGRVLQPREIDQAFKEGKFNLFKANNTQASLRLNGFAIYRKIPLVKSLKILKVY